MFQSTRPARGATRKPLPFAAGCYVSIHAPRTGRDNSDGGDCSGIAVSIHAPRTGRDAGFGQGLVGYYVFQSTRPARGATLRMLTLFCFTLKFQSTRPARGATGTVASLSASVWVSIHAPRTGRDRHLWMVSTHQPVSIHAPRTGRDSPPSRTESSVRVSIHAPRTGRDLNGRHIVAAGEVSIHAPRTGRDSPNANVFSWVLRFQSTRPARGATRDPELLKKAQTKFQSTRPARGATRWGSAFVSLSVVSIHAPRTGRDAALRAPWAAPACFNPRAPHGARRR